MLVCDHLVVKSIIPALPQSACKKPLEEQRYDRVICDSSRSEISRDVITIQFQERFGFVYGCMNSIY